MATTTEVYGKAHKKGKKPIGIWADAHPPFHNWKDRATWAMLRSAGLTAEQAGHVMWEETCYPMDSDMSMQQANEFLEKHKLFSKPKEIKPKK